MRSTVSWTTDAFANSTAEMLRFKLVSCDGGKNGTRKRQEGSYTIDGLITVAYEVCETDWKPSVSDNGGGKSGAEAQCKSGLGTGIIKTLARQLNAEFANLTEPQSRTASVIHATFGTSVEAHRMSVDSVDALQQRRGGVGLY